MVIQDKGTHKYWSYKYQSVSQKKKGNHFVPYGEHAGKAAADRRCHEPFVKRSIWRTHVFYASRANKNKKKTVVNLFLANYPLSEL